MQYQVLSVHGPTEVQPASRRVEYSGFWSSSHLCRWWLLGHSKHYLKDILYDTLDLMVSLLLYLLSRFLNLTQSRPCSDLDTIDPTQLCNVSLSSWWPLDRKSSGAMRALFCWSWREHRVDGYISTASLISRLTYEQCTSLLCKRLRQEIALLSSVWLPFDVASLFQQDSLTFQPAWSPDCSKSSSNSVPNISQLPVSWKTCPFFRSSWPWRMSLPHRRR